MNTPADRPAGDCPAADRPAGDCPAADRPAGDCPAADRPAGERGAPARVTLLSKPGCHLCEDARATIAAVAAEVGVGWEEIDITSDEQLYRRWWEQIPVTLVDGAQHDFWRVSADRLRAALR